MTLKNFLNKYITLYFFIFIFIATNAQSIKVGAEDTHAYIALLTNKKVGIITNLSGRIGDVHIVDSLINRGINIVKIYSPEHGFRGDIDAAQTVHNGIDAKTNLPIISLYGKSKKPSVKQVKGIDIMIFDIQDVGVRFYTYISTLHYVMETCAENNIEVIVLDRPNPNAHYIDGNILNMNHRSFVGMHPVPIVYGMTIGEYAQMINGEKWLKNKIECKLTVIACQNYHHKKNYTLPVKPSPNLPNGRAINLYPSLGLFEGTPINAGRGTNLQFQIYGHHLFPKSNFSYTPVPKKGAKYPKEKNKLCYGVDLTKQPKLNQINLEWLIDAYQKFPDKHKFFGKTFTIHAGSTTLQKQIENGLSARQIKKTWQKGIEKFKKIRKKYLIYK